MSQSRLHFSCLAGRTACVFGLLWLLMILTCDPQARAMIDLNGNGMSDIWEMRFHAQGLDPNGNADNDGVADLIWQNVKTSDNSVWLMAAGAYSSGVALPQVPVEWRIVGIGDFDGDGQNDILWQDMNTGVVAIWLMKNGAYSSGVVVGQVPTDWHIVGVADFNGDNQPDILWQNTTTGECSIWLMNHTAYGSGVSLGTVLPTTWQIVGAGDFNGDKKPDIVWQNTQTGERSIWLMNGTAFASGVSLPQVSTDWNIAAVGDVNGDGQPDLIWQNTTTGQRSVWIMNGVNYARGIDLGVVSTDWQIRTAGDFNNDGLTNLQESRAGTDPFDPRSTLRITQIDYGTGTVTLHWPSVAGKQYQLYASTDPTQNGGGWTPLGGPVAGTGKPMAATFSVTVAQRFFRIDVSDLDSDGDGVSDWEEIQLGLNPYSAYSDGVTPDYQRVVAALQATTNTITVTATDSFGSAASGDAGVFTITRTGRLDALTINYSLGGTATPGTDYTAPSGTVTLPLGAASATVRITPLANSAMTTPRTVILNVSAGASYTVGTPASATVSLAPRPTSGQVLQEIWTGLAYGEVSLIPVTASPVSSRLLTTLENPKTAPLGNNYGTRIRGYLNAPTTGNYTFWIASDDQSELWISTDRDPANLVKRAYVLTYTGSRQWTKEANQQSKLIALTAGKKYYFEVLQANGSGGENLAVGWLKPGESGTAPSEIVGATAGTLDPYIPAVMVPDPSTLYFSNLLPVSGGPSAASGTATLRLSPDGTFAVVTVHTSNLAKPLTTLTINGPADSGQSAGVLVDLLAATPQSDGSYLWNFTTANGQSPAAIAQAIQAGRTYVSVANANYPSGALRGQLALRSATGSFTPPADPPPLPPGLPTAADAARFLTQATFGPNAALQAQVQRNGFNAFLDAQFNLPLTLSTPGTDAAIAAAGGTTSNSQFFNVWWKNAINAPDQLRQRVAFALTEIMVISQNSNGLTNTPIALSSYYDLLVRDAFGNFRQLLEDVTLNPTMGNYLDMEHNDKEDPTKGTAPNENYAREVMQLFTIGLNKLNPDGTLQLDSNNQPILSYDQDVVEGYAHVFTGWYYASATPSWNYTPADYRAPMIAFPEHHDGSAKELLDNVVLSAGQSQAQDLKDALDVLFNHPNVGPFIAQRLIQRLVTSNPSPAYVYRVAKVFADNGQGVRGDMAAVVKAILLDYEARTTTKLTDPNFGKEREPIVRLTNLYRAFNASSTSGNIVLGDQTSNLGESIFDSPTVFNFFTPEFAQPGPIAQAGLVSPEFQITTDTTVITSANKMLSAVFQTPSSSNPDALVLDLSGLQALAGDPGGLVDSLNTLLMGGEMSQATRNRVVSAVTAISATNPLGRSQTAVYLLSTSPEFVIQK
ncbi:MAG: DUF1800 family protein [Verrucomicrobia bacterium]|nr:DUF1800 family protein [Verrucomicrobiota bacterium]